ncbi:MAG TPA: PPC domain-containing protein [Bryobacteraceae bacterium]|nr:PPC domain-containing protein [Bryobacteraceae bacterium]
MRRGAWLLALCCAAYAGAPVITELQPRGAERGHSFTLTITGRNLAADARIASTLPASFTPVNAAQKMDGMSGAIAFLVEPRPDVAPGLYPIRVESSKGISNVLLFTIGTFPEVAEEESLPYSRPNRNDSIETAQPIQSTPVTVNGTLRGPERDVFRVYGKAGERRVFEIEARRCGSAIDPVLRILDGSGKQLARSDDAPGAGLDPRIDFTFPHEGNYYVEVHDARFSRQAQNFYRLKMGAYAYADGIFPLGGKRGETTEVSFFGAGLKAAVKTTVDLKKLAPESGFATVSLPVSLPDSPTLPMLFAVSDLPELIAPFSGELPVPSVMNGRLLKPGQIDRYRLKVQPGENLLFELQARELGTSRLEGIVTIYDSNGKKLDSAGDKPLAEDVFAVQGTSRTSNDPYLNFTVPKDLREITVAVEDLAERGGPLYGYRLITRREAEDFQLATSSPYLNIPAGGTALLNVVADRRGYDGPIQLTIPNLPKGMHVEGGFIPREYVDASNARTFNRRGTLTITADPDAELPPIPLQAWGEGQMSNGKALRRRARGPGIVVGVAGATDQGVVDRQRSVTAPWLGLELPAAIAEPPAGTLQVKQTNFKKLDEGGRYEFEYVWNLRTGTPVRNVNVEVVGARDIRVIEIKRAGKGGTFAVTTTKATDPAKYDLYITGRLNTDSGEETIVSRPIPFEVSEGTAK